MPGMSQPPGEDTRSETPAPRYQPLVIVLVAVCAGIVADRAWGAPVEAWSAVAVAAWVGWAVLRWGRWDRAAGLVLLASAAACGGLWHHVRWNLFEANDLGCYCGRGRQPVGIEAIALGEPERVPAPPFDPMRIVPEFDRSRLEVKVAAVRDGTRWRPASGRARLTVDGHLLGVQAGDRLRVFGQLWAPRSRMNPGDWDSAAYHRADRRLSQVVSGYPECVSVVRRSGLLHSRRWLEDVRTAGTRLLEARLDRRRAALAATVLLGAREEITHDEEQAFVETGTVHLLAISGLHVGIVAWALLGALRLAMVPARRAVVVVAAAAVLYTMLTHARPPAIRAMILVLTFCAATYLGRPRLTFNALAAAALVVLAL
jgi:competence protein ComEC